MRRIVEQLPLETRVELDKAAETEDLGIVDNIITEEVRQCLSHFSQPTMSDVRTNWIRITEVLLKNETLAT